MAAIKITSNLHSEALILLEQGERLLEVINKLFILSLLHNVIVLLYNTACCHQSLWDLQKCSKYIEGVIYNIEASLKEDEYQNTDY